ARRFRTSRLFFWLKARPAARSASAADELAYLLLRPKLDGEIACADRALFDGAHHQAIALAQQFKLTRFAKQRPRAAAALQPAHPDAAGERTARDFKKFETAAARAIRRRESALIEHPAAAAAAEPIDAPAPERFLLIPRPNAPRPLRLHAIGASIRHLIAARFDVRDRAARPAEREHQRPPTSLHIDFKKICALQALDEALRIGMIRAPNPIAAPLGPALEREGHVAGAVERQPSGARAIILFIEAGETELHAAPTPAIHRRADLAATKLSAALGVGVSSLLGIAPAAGLRDRGLRARRRWRRRLGRTIAMAFQSLNRSVRSAQRKSNLAFAAWQSIVDNRHKTATAFKHIDRYIYIYFFRVEASARAR
ncbi:MAG: hypothetical protein AAGM38_09000, partial [Pseudomonadota bacterium]